MPLYDYYCDKCKIVFERYVSVSERNNIDCDCGKKAQKLISNVGTAVDSSLKDLKGNPIWFKEPYFDRSLQVKFHSKKHKQDYMNKHGLIMDGSDNPKRWPIESGDMRHKSNRREAKME